jgi:nucleotide-binding universal stress UspA family protein
MSGSRATRGDGPAADRGGAARRYLIVANQTLDSDELAQAIRERAAAGPSEFWAVVPATAVKDLAGRSVPLTPMPVMGGALSIPASPEEGRQLANAKLEAARRKLTGSGVQLDGEVGDEDPVRAVAAALKQREFDEIIVSTLPARLSRWLRADFPRRLEQKFGLPVTHVEVPKFTLRREPAPR